MKQLTAFVIAAIFISSCNKADDIRNQIVTAPSGPPPANTKIKTQESGGSVSLYEYDNSGRVKKITTNGVVEYSSTYAGDSLIQTRYLANGAVMETYHIKLTAGGLVENYLNDKYPTIFIKYEYNADNRTERKLNYNSGILSGITYYFYSNGNLVKDSTVGPSAPGTWSGRTYEYYTDKYSTLENENRGQAHWGAGNKNAIKKITYITNGVPYGTQDYQTPEVVQLNRISKTGMTANGSGSPTIYNYTYY
jgi:hypothetical protein